MDTKLDESDEQGNSSGAVTAKGGKVRAAVGMASAIVAFFVAQILWMLIFASLGVVPMQQQETSTSFFVLLFSGMALGLGAGYVVGNLVEGQPLRDIARRILGPLGSALSWTIVGFFWLLLLVVGYYVFRGIAALPVSVAIVFGALIVAGAIKR